MRLSPSYYPEYIDFTCGSCDADNYNVKVESIEGDDVNVFCTDPYCRESNYVKVID